MTAWRNSPRSIPNCCAGASRWTAPRCEPLGPIPPVVNNFTFQWFKRGQGAPISGATFGYYTFTASDATEGQYVVRIKESDGDIIFSDFAKVTVTDAPPPSSAPTIASALPSELVGLPLPQVQRIRIIGSGFITSSTLLFNGSIASDPARLYFISANEIQYDIRTGIDAANWTVKVINGAQQSIGEGSSLVVADVSNPASAQAVGRLAMPGMMQDIAVSGQYAFVANNDAGLQVVDCSTPSVPKLVAFTTRRGCRKAWLSLERTPSSRTVMAGFSFLTSRFPNHRR